MLTRIIRVCALLCGTLVAAPVVHAQETEFKVVVNASNPVVSMRKTELSRLFLRKVTTWADGQQVALVEPPESAPTRRSFCRSVHGRELGSIQSYWQGMIFSGRAVPPVQKNDDAEVLAFVGTNRNALGYVSADAPLPAGVKAVALEQ
jgi:ABC-type phosphate transport system substrate-binding protein